MATAASLDPMVATAERLVDFLEADGFNLEAAVWSQDEADRWRLYLLPSNRSEGSLRSTVGVAYTLSRHADELPDREDLLFSVVGPNDPIIRAVKGLNLGKVRERRRVDGVYGDGQYVDRAYILRLN